MGRNRQKGNEPTALILRSFLRYIASFFYPFTVETSRSDKNPFLEISYENGKTVLNAERVNYSHGSLQKTFEEVFDSLKIKNRAIANVLILGLGAGSVVRILNAQGYKGQITGVEWDAETLRLAEKHFGFTANEKLKIVVEEASAFINRNQEVFDLIVIDLFVEEFTPETAETPAFLANLSRSLATGGLLLFNRIINSAETRQRTEHFEQLFRVVFPDYFIFRTDVNRVFVADAKLKR